MDGWTDDGCMDGSIDEQMDVRMMEGSMDEWMDGRMMEVWM